MSSNYVCLACGFPSEEALKRCTECGAFNSFIIDVHFQEEGISSIDPDSDIEEIPQDPCDISAELGIPNMDD